jgi:aquaporin Z
MEAGSLGAFILSASAFGALLWHPASPVAGLVQDGTPRRALMGLAMSLTLLAIVFSPWGKQSGAHLNPAVTLTFLRLGRVRPWDAAFYVAAQFLGGLAGIGIAALLLGSTLSHPAVGYIATVPGPLGPGVAFAAEGGMAFVMMTTVLNVAKGPFSRWTGLAAALLVAAFITWEAPLSGMSMNPARTLGPAVIAMRWTGIWVYFVAPPLGMLAAGEVFRRVAGGGTPCAKLHHENPKRCIFCNRPAALGRT